jgi:hypothetical protein
MVNQVYTIINNILVTIGSVKRFHCFNPLLTMQTSSTVEHSKIKLLSFPKVEGIVFGYWGEASEATHKLVDALATIRARVAEPFF